jgi:hypothetical protein
MSTDMVTIQPELVRHVYRACLNEFAGACEHFSDHWADVDFEVHCEQLDILDRMRPVLDGVPREATAAVTVEAPLVPAIVEGLRSRMALTRRGLETAREEGYPDEEQEAAAEIAVMEAGLSGLVGS